jgi:hypothetical protein
MSFSLDHAPVSGSEYTAVHPECLLRGRDPARGGVMHTPHTQCKGPHHCDTVTGLGRSCPWLGSFGSGMVLDALSVRALNCQASGNDLRPVAGRR